MIPSSSHSPLDASKPVLGTTVGGVLREAAELAPDQVGLLSRGIEAESRREWTYAELLEEAEQMARALLGRFDPGDRVAVWAPN